MVRMASIKFGTGVVSRPNTVSTATGTTLGGGSTSSSPGIASKIPVSTNYGPSVNQISGTGSGISIASKISAPTIDTSSNTNYKLSIASMLLAMKNQALGSLSLGGSKAGAGGTITENYSGINLG